MNQELFDRVKTKRALLILSDQEGRVLWESAASPASALYVDYFKGRFENLGELTVYANQAGLAVAVLAEKIGIKSCFAYRMSECGWKRFQEIGVKASYEELIPLVRSSKDESRVCPIEEYLSQHEAEEDRWEFLEERFGGEGEKKPACSIEKHKQAGLKQE